MRISDECCSLPDWIRMLRFFLSVRNSSICVYMLLYVEIQYILNKSIKSVNNAIRFTEMIDTIHIKIALVTLNSSFQKIYSIFA